MPAFGITVATPEKPQGVPQVFNPTDAQIDEAARFAAMETAVVGRSTRTAPIRFYRASEQPYGCFSNLYRCSVEFEGAVFASAEHAYQAGKPRKPKVRAWLLAAPSPSLLAATAHALYPWDVAPGWSKGRYQRMLRVVEAKFTQHPELATVLMSTGNAQLIESATVDNEVNRRWGQVKIRGEWVGTNWLGEVLMEVRARLSVRAAS